MHIVDQACLRDGWTRIRAHGRGDFILRYGVRGFALETGSAVWIILFLAVPLFFQGDGGPDWGYLGSRPFWLSLAASAVLWPAAGFAWGAWEWARREARWRRGTAATRASR